MSIKKLCGYLLLGLTFLSTAFFISFSQISSYIDKCAGHDFYLSFFGYINPVAAACIGMSFIISLFLILGSECENIKN